MTMSAMARSKRNLSRIIYPPMDGGTLEILVSELKSGHASAQSKRHAAVVISTLLPKKIGRPRARTKDMRFILLAQTVEAEESDIFGSEEKPHNTLQQALLRTLEWEKAEGKHRDISTHERYYRRGLSEIAEMDQPVIKDISARIKNIGIDAALQELNALWCDHSLRVTARRYERAERKRKKTTPI